MTQTLAMSLMGMRKRRRRRTRKMFLSSLPLPGVQTSWLEEGEGNALTEEQGDEDEEHETWYCGRLRVVG
jgi:hypothetical protein